MTQRCGKRNGAECARCKESDDAPKYKGGNAARMLECGAEDRAYDVAADRIGQDIANFCKRRSLRLAILN